MTREDTLSSQDVYDKHQSYLFPAVKNFYQSPAVIVEGKGTLVRDLDGKEYLDFFGGILTISVGHANEKVNQAVIAQVQRLNHVTSLYPTLPMVNLAEKLAQITPGQLQKCFFTASGTEADETAVMMAQVATGNNELVALRHGYSGRSLLCQTLTAHSPWRAIPTQVAAVKHALAPYCYRCPLKLRYPSCGVACAQDIKELIDTTTTGRVAGILAEPIQGVGGFITPPPEYFEIVAEIIRAHGGVFIADEVQTGFGRTGTMWGIEQYGVEPDMMTMAKGIANGFPLGALVATPVIADSLTKNTISTFGGNPVSSAAASATIDVIEQENLAENAANMGLILMEGLRKIQHQHPQIVGDVRGKGLMLGIELVADETIEDRTPNTSAMADLLEATRERGLLIGKGGLYGNAVRMSPPLNVSEDEIHEALSRLSDAFDAIDV